MKCIKVLGEGCEDCKKLYDLVVAVLEDLELTDEIKVCKVHEVNKIISYGVMMTPGLVINEQVKSCGYLPRRFDIERWVEELVGETHYSH